jgi:osmotically-inducible protein OsmY
MAEWDRDRERYEPERDLWRDYFRAGLGYGTSDAGRAGQVQRGVWTMGGEPRSCEERRGPGPHAGKGPRGYRRSDARIHEDVCDRLESDPDVDASDIEVSVAGGEVTLVGAVADRRMRWLAEEVTAGCPGVKEVWNRLRVPRRSREA